MESQPIDCPVRPGDLVAEKYRVDRVLGAGGFGVVVAATHIELDEKVALKFLLASALRPDVVERFLREARASVRVKSEHVAKVRDVGRLPTGAPYMVMELLTGRDLAAELAVSGPLPVGVVVAYMLQACRAIAEAHALGIVHRDLKPANLFLTRRDDGTPLVKVLDFGIAKALDPEGAGGVALTRTSDAMGSPLYMSPEQMMSAKGVDARTDIWSLGVILYELTAGRPPFDGETMPAVCAAIISGTPNRLHDVAPGLPMGFADVVMRCLEKDPGRRFADVGALAEALAPFEDVTAAGGPTAPFRISTRPGTVSGLDATVATSPTFRAVSGAASATTGGRAPLVLGVILAVAAVAAVAGWKLTSKPGGVPDAPAAATAPPAPSSVSPSAPSASPAAPSSAPPPEVAPVLAAASSVPSRAATRPVPLPPGAAPAKTQDRTTDARH